MWSTARHSIRLGDAEPAAADLAGIDNKGRHTPRDEAERLGIRAGLAALAGRPAEAIRLYQDALQAFHELGSVLQEAQTAIEMATVLDPALPEVADAIANAREILTGLRATSYLSQLEAAIHRQPLVEAAHPVRSPDPSSV